MDPTTEKNRPDNGIRLFKIFGIQISLDLSWFIIFAIVILGLSAGYFPRKFPDEPAHVYWTAGFLATLLFFGSILVHELAHSVAALLSGIGIHEIRLFLFGGISKISQEAKDPKTEIFIAAVGPATSFAIAFLFWVIRLVVQGVIPPIAVEVLVYLTWINVALGVFNLVPGFPLDGGRILRAAVWLKSGSLTRATRIASDVGKGFALTLMILGGFQFFMGNLVGGLWLFFIGMFLRGIARGGYQELIVRQALEGIQVREIMLRNPVTVSPGLSLKELAEDYFLKFGYHAFPVMEGGAFGGVVSIGQVKDIPVERRETTYVRDIMKTADTAAQARPEDSLADSLKRMTQTGAGLLVIMEHGKMAGILTKTGLLRFIEVKHILEPENPKA